MRQSPHVDSNAACLYENGKIKFPVEPADNTIDMKVALQLCDLNPCEQKIVCRKVLLHLKRMLSFNKTIFLNIIF